MPYIKQSRRRELNHVVNDMLCADLQPHGDLNYILYAYCKRCIAPGYTGYKNYLGELTEAAAEIRRRLLAPYEDEKIRENGDIS